MADTIRVFERVTINPPTATTNAASTVGQLTAKLNATVNANLHAVTKCTFQYTDDADFQVNAFASADETPCSAKPAGAANTPVSANLSGLAPATTYHYRVVATNNGGQTEGSDQTFATLPATAPTVVTGTASGLTESAATLTGSVNPHGGPYPTAISNTAPAWRTGKASRVPPQSDPLPPRCPRA